MTRLALRNVLRYWRHSRATLTVMTLGFVALCLFDGFIGGIQSRIEDGYVQRAMLGHVVVFREGAPEHMDEDTWKYTLGPSEQRFLENFLAHDSNVAVRVRHLTVSGLISNGSRSAVFVGFGQDVSEGAAARGPRWAWNAVAGRPLQLASPFSVLLGQGLADLLGCEATGSPAVSGADGGFIPRDRPFGCEHASLRLVTTTEHDQVNAIDVEPAGLVDAGWKNADRRLVNLPLPLAQKLADTDRITMVSIRLKDPRPAAALAFISRLQDRARQASVPLEVLPWSEHPNAITLRSTTRMVFVFRALFLAVLALISTLTISNTLVRTVTERTREIGTLRSLGFQAGEISRVFACEGLLLAAIACAIGWVLAGALAFLLSRSGIVYRAGILSVPIPLEIRFSPLLWSESTLALLALGTVTAAWIARRIVRLPPAEALRVVS